MQENPVQKIITVQREFFSAGRTRTAEFRLDALKKLKAAIIANERQINEALLKDLHKPLMESYASETGFVINEINHALKNLGKWMRSATVRPSFMVFPSRSTIINEPYGAALIIGAWNYPFQLTLGPLVGAIAAGNCCIVKPSELAPESSRIVGKIIGEAFDETHVAAVEGGVEVSRHLLEQRFDKIFFTGSPGVGKIVAEMAARQLTPVTLELGGKSPCIVDRDTDIDAAARRILWGKFLNAGQTCVAPDYALVHAEVKEKFYAACRKRITEFYGDRPEASPDFPRIVNKKHFIRLKGYLEEGKIILGGQYDENGLYIAPTVMETDNMDSPVMREEIFGPILPVIAFTTLDEAEKIIGLNPDPLAFYLFSKNRGTVKRLTERVPFGGGCINDTLSHIMNPRLPFGGRGNSGMGCYHGKFGFDAFSHRKSVLKKGFAFEMKMKFPPYGDGYKYLKKLLMR